MKRRITAIIMATVMLTTMLTGCAQTKEITDSLKSAATDAAQNVLNSVDLAGTLESAASDAAKNALDGTGIVDTLKSAAADAAKNLVDSTGITDALESAATDAAKNALDSTGITDVVKEGMNLGETALDAVGLDESALADLGLDGKTLEELGLDEDTLRELGLIEETTQTAESAQAAAAPEAAATGKAEENETAEKSAEETAAAATAAAETVAGAEKAAENTAAEAPAETPATGADKTAETKAAETTSAETSKASESAAEILGAAQAGEEAAAEAAKTADLETAKVLASALEDLDVIKARAYLQAYRDRAEDVEKIITSFKKLAAIPRPSGSEKKVSDFLFKWAKTAGTGAKQDKVGNVIVDIPATEGCEDKPLTILQAHMDMVAVAEEGFTFNPKKDPITIVRSDMELKAEHTSLGADDGIGVAIAQYIAENCKKHGPLRLIFTVDEEVNMTGAKNLDPAELADAGSLINIDWEESDSIAVTSASNIVSTYTKKAKWEENPYNNPVEIRVTGGLGGHSGLEINKGKANANIIMADLLTALKKAGVRYCLASMEGGTASNAITAIAKAVVTVHEDDNQKVSEQITQFNEQLREKYAFSDPDIHIEELYPNLLVQKVMTEQDRDSLLTLLTSLVCGVYTMSSKIENFVESSSNVGIVKVSENECKILTSTRSSEGYPEVRMINAQEQLANSQGFSAESEKNAFAWSYDPKNPLLKIAGDVYLAQNGVELKESFVHAGLECGGFKQKNSKLNIISVGPEVKNAHSPEETVWIPSIAVTLNLVEGILAKLAE